MAAKQLLFHSQAHAKFLAGMGILANAVRATLGPKARTVILERSFGAPSIINSGVVVAKEVELEDPFENSPARLPTSPATGPRPRRFLPAALSPRA